MMCKEIKLNLLVVALLFLFSLASIPVNAQSELEAVAIRIVAERNSIPVEQLTAENSARLDFPMQEISVSSFKITDVKGGNIYPITLDDSGNEIDEEGMQIIERERYIARYGKLELELARIVEEANPDELIEVTFWLNQARFVSLDRPAANLEMNQEDVDQVFSKLDAERSEIAREATLEFTERLANMGISAESDELTPTVNASVPVSVLKELSYSDEIDMVYLQREHGNQLATARPTIGANLVHNTGNTGQGVRIAQVEVGGFLSAGNPWLFGVVQDTPNGCFNNHGTNVAGVLRSTHGFVRGIAPDALLWAGGSCRGVSRELQNRTNAATNWGARSVNLSFGSDPRLSLGSLDRFYDDVVQNGWRTIVAAAGNNNPPFGSRTGNVGSPALAYNLISVGSFDHQNDAFWGNDAVSNFSSWRDPNSSHGDREKPEVSAPGCVQTTSFNGFGTTCGTSFAAPMVTGTSALMMRSNPSLSVWPEAVKSILMATSVHNIEGQTRLSEFDGAGGIVADRANQVAQNTNGTWGAQGYSCRNESNMTVSSLHVDRGRRVRVVMSWDTNPTFWNFTYGSRPSADLDMQILDPNGNIVASSLSWDNTYEIVDFNAPATGSYTLRVSKYRCNHDPKWLGWAWHIV